ncbi:complement factor B [Cuculus canorus]|uniref:complement factor B n=1 Tax=Cuculus canorus TaxID=55661 RepID=UPI0023AACABE|nr:complement factor B [Cuculus canorus]
MRRGTPELGGGLGGPQDEERDPGIGGESQGDPRIQRARGGGRQRPPERPLDGHRQRHPPRSGSGALSGFPHLPLFRADGGALLRGGGDSAAWVGVEIDRGTRWEVSGVFQHPQFDLGGRRHRGVPEFYDYDVALVQLSKAVTPQLDRRPLCLPCTEGASRALRLPPAQSTCEEHRRLLLPPRALEAFFVSVSPEGQRRQQIHLQLGAQRSPCEADALRAPPYANASALDDVVTARFLCSGGADPHPDPNACRGDSGGPVIVTRGRRYFQVGVISWGVMDACGQRRAPPHARDFHVNVFEVVPWLRERLRHEDIGFLP